jgi:predicted transcriptional regulator of viral defense system
MKFQNKQFSLPQNRALLARVLSSSRDVINIDHVTQALGISRTDGAKRLARWVEQGWLHRVGRGVYVPVALDTRAEQILDDLGSNPSLYDPPISRSYCCEYWDLPNKFSRT